MARVHCIRLQTQTDRLEVVTVGGGGLPYERGGGSRRLAHGCKFLGKTPLYLAVKVSFRVAYEEI